MSGIIFKTERDLEAMRPACAVASEVLEAVAGFIRPGVTTKQIDDFAAEAIKKHDAKSAFLGYVVRGRKYPCNVCISVNEEVVHGLARDRRVEFGDIISLDVGVRYNGFIGDTAKTVPVGGCGVAAQRLLDVTEQALYEGIAQAVAGNRVVDISRAIQKYVEGHGYSVVREFVGHGVGRSVHEEPQVPNFVEHGKKSPTLRPGMTIAIEPMVNAGRPEVKVLKDGWTVVTIDGQLSAHFEHTVLIREGEPEIFDVPGEDAIRLEGVVVEVLKEARLFRVELGNGHRLLGHVSQRWQRRAAELKTGDKVNLEMSSFDFSKGRIVLEEKQK